MCNTWRRLSVCTHFQYLIGNAVADVLYNVALLSITKYGGEREREIKKNVMSNKAICSPVMPFLVSPNVTV